MSDSKKDTLYAKKLKKIEQFSFDDSVATVFDDMIKRSVPGYQAINNLLPIIANRYIQASTNVYDLGCSLGEASLTMASVLNKSDVQIIAVDSSPAMVNRLTQKISDLNLQVPVWPVCKDILEEKIKNASFVVLNYTLQFIQQSERYNLIQEIFTGLNNNGALLLTEKIRFENEDEDEEMRKQHELFKKENNYSELEISQKREALEKVLVRDTNEQHISRLKKAGFKNIKILTEYLNFTSYLAIK